MYFVRTASERDVPAIRTLLREAYLATYGPLHGAEKATALDAELNADDVIRQCVKDPAGEFLVADNGRELGGAAYACYSRSKPKSAQLVKLYVKPGLLRQGIGRDLFAEIETCFPKAERMWLEVDGENAAALAFYRAHGFAEAGTVSNCGGAHTGIAALVMEKTLEPAG